MCSCQKKPKHGGPTYVSEVKPEQWGPLMWKFLHISAERLGRSSVPILETDTANAIQLVVNGLPDILPCVECQGHARTYLFTNKFITKDLTGAALRTYVRNYLFTFHAAVRARKGQPVLVETPEACAALYESATLTGDDDKRMADYFRYALMYRIVNSTKYMRWWDVLRRLRLMLGY
jgi:hypothetical protein